MKRLPGEINKKIGFITVEGTLRAVAFRSGKFLSLQSAQHMALSLFL